jgi:hypothetical protein
VNKREGGAPEMTGNSKCGLRLFLFSQLSFDSFAYGQTAEDLDQALSSSLNTPVDMYCERLGPEFWAEHRNALSNIAFLVAGLVGLMLANRLKAESKPSSWVLLLSCNSIVIGVGSFLFHTFATKWAMLADVIPISIFMCLYLAFALDRILVLKKTVTAFAVLVFLLIGLSAPKIAGDALNGSVGYFPAWATLAIVGHFVKAKNWPVAKLLLVAMAVFAVSLGFRIVDHSVCDSFSLGTHFLWHSFNGVLIATLIYAAFVAESSLPNRARG